MSVNPNVDRLSIDERLRKLESRFPGGGSGGGSFGGTLPDFDQYPDNAFKLTPDGIIGKVSFADFGQETGLNSFPGVDVKLCFYMPLKYGIPIGSFLLLTRMKYTRSFVSIGNSIGSTIQFAKTIDAQDLITPYYLGPNKQYADLTIYCSAKNNAGVAHGMQFLNLRLVDGQTAKPHLAGVNRLSTVEKQWTIVPCTSFGVYISPMFPIGSEQLVRFYNFTNSYPWCGSSTPVIGPNITVDNPQDLPNSFKPFYPSSWYQ